MIKKIIEEARRWVGYLEKKDNNYLEEYTKNAGYNNYTIFAQQYLQYFGENYQAQPWCAMFVSCMFRSALGEDVQKEIMPHFAYCPTGVNQFKKKGCWHTSNPQKGDVIFFKDSSGLACHVGIVYDVTYNKVYTIEGNTSTAEGVIDNGGAVCEKSYAKNHNKVLGYGRPKYEALEETPWQQEFLYRLVNKKYISDIEEWSQYDDVVSKSLCVALIDKVTGGLWKSEEADSNIHWVQPHIISLMGKGIIEDKEEWLSFPDSTVSKALILALIDKATEGTIEKYKNQQYDHWARANLNSLCDKGIIETPEVWCDDFEAETNKGILMALICKAFNI